ncbi:hypothetical protein CON65_11450 [Bacillus pseudomycoides]|uniref:Immunity protein Imm6 n=1 Tax=Bacillus pseudomycoides TaxID=64104 RepID=A0AA91ZTP7_9BACI|nr:MULTISPECIES: Imm6 family immunity protein [Bacillus]PEB47524.1 hypothetical protein COO03_25645 [Bacillus sp. AFS098217]PED82557.1 hypothetical protein CON65_11450 [Bacillus pseudomycoides]PEU07775.1 hypothetical protein CN525_26455 [Bacillus sp. AFS014408]PEU17248.1 hypothetical protein CN524_02530 [Bacillus sp. AFS019443]PFW61179.1 hypothetical protein COL20_18625 [Bacillus sp. AFS075034]
MDCNLIYPLEDDVKVAFILTIAEKIFQTIKKDDERYLAGRDALDKCWIWVESKGVSGDDLYELIDNADCTSIFEFAEDEEDLRIARLWSSLVDIVAYTAWKAYIREKTKYLPQTLEGIKEEHLEIVIESAIETTFITKEEIQSMQQSLLSTFQVTSDGIIEF